ncbi:PqqD family peptide modification chaperone [Nocardioides plantarum]|uniref:PqqD family peptide modification chaperone n=1 Tax=Nocardioides plantarum TaxID=29299 RepID=A0ABV5K6E3_9ACTN|nr:PqqD family peptide modification chaperone [Nocardioides plantarum]
MRVERAAWVDWYDDGRRSAVLVDDQVIVLSTLATSMVRHVVGGTLVDDLVTALVTEFGAPDGGDAHTATQAAVRDLVECGVLAEVTT